jgi:hypothetical protein
MRLLAVIEKSSRFPRQFGGLAELDQVLFVSSIFQFLNDSIGLVGRHAADPKSQIHVTTGTVTLTLVLG